MGPRGRRTSPQYLLGRKRRQKVTRRSVAGRDAGISGEDWRKESLTSLGWLSYDEKINRTTASTSCLCPSIGPLSLERLRRATVSSCRKPIHSFARDPRHSESCDLSRTYLRSQTISLRSSPRLGATRFSTLGPS